MERPLFLKIIGAIFICIAVFIVVRLILGLNFSLDGVTIPAWISLVGAVISIYLAWSAWWL